MDIAYDRVQEESYAPTETSSKPISGAETNPGSINTEFAQAFKAVSDSPWASRLGGWLSQARKQGETFYNDLQKEASEAQEQATRGFTSLREQVVQRTRGMSLNAEPGPAPSVPGEEGVPEAAVNDADKLKDEPETTTTAKATRADNLPADIVKEAGSLVSSFRSTAAARLKDLQAAEDAADEALLRFGTNVRDFLRSAVIITGPDDPSEHGQSEVLFETSEAGTGKKIFHTTRLDAQLHAIHNAVSSFTTDPEGEQWTTWKEQFDVEKQTDAIAADLNKYEELRRAMEKLVPEKMDYKTFWARYYFLRKAIDEEEKRRKEVLKGATTGTEEEVGWGDDDDDEESATPNTTKPKTTETRTGSTTPTTLKPAELNSDNLAPPRRSHEDENKSVADSDTSYDLVSGATTHGQTSPRETKKDDESDDDWE